MHELDMYWPIYIAKVIIYTAVVNKAYIANASAVSHAMTSVLNWHRNGFMRLLAPRIINKIS